jgi:hypothetical protein
MIQLFFIPKFATIKVREKGQESLVWVNILWNSRWAAVCTLDTIDYLQRSLPLGTQSCPIIPLAGY